MYENIRKPGWLRHTPAVLIRSLPAVYYYARYVVNTAPPKVKSYYQMQIRYLEQALKALGRELALPEFENCAVQFAELIKAAPEKRLKMTESVTRNMTACCDKWHATLQQERSRWTLLLKQLFDKTVTPLQLILVDYHKDPARIEKLHHVLTSSCHYEVNCITAIEDTYQTQILSADCLIFTDIQPSYLHRDYDRLKSYGRPALAIIPRQDSEDIRTTAIRHAGQLSRLGVDILFYFLTPIRLYTSIEKNYMHFYGSAGNA